MLIQDLRKISVEIRDITSQRIVGTGFIIKQVSRQLLIVTCAHVIQKAECDPYDESGAVEIFFPQDKVRLTGHPFFGNTALQGFSDDIALIEIGIDSLPNVFPAAIGYSHNAYGHRFRSWGYKTLPPYEGSWVEGEILGPVQIPESPNFKLEPIQLKCRGIDYGMSGAPVLDLDQGKVIGVITSFWTPQSSKTKDDDIAYATPIEVLETLSFDVSHSEPSISAPQSLGFAPSVFSSYQLSENVPFEPQLATAPEICNEWTGRDEFLSSLTQDWENIDIKITGVVGFGGTGKSTLVRTWLEILLKESKPDGVFWWSFDKNPNVDDFLVNALNYLSQYKFDRLSIPGAAAKAQLLLTSIRKGRFLFVLDGLEILQRPSGDDYGAIENDELRSLLNSWVSPGHDTFCVVISRAPLTDLIQNSGYMHRELISLRAKEGSNLLRNYGVVGDDQELEAISSAWNGHALTLKLIAGYLITHSDGQAQGINTIPEPVGNDEGESLQRILRHYDTKLSTLERSFLQLYAAFDWEAIPLSFFTAIAGGKSKTKILGQSRTASYRITFEGKKLTVGLPIYGIEDDEIHKIAKRVCNYRLLHVSDKSEDQLISHRLIRDYFYSQLKDMKKNREIHDYLAKVFLSPQVMLSQRLQVSQSAWQSKNFGDARIDLDRPKHEAIYHFCRAGEFEVAYAELENLEIVRSLYKWGRYETILGLLKFFFQDGDLSKPLLITPSTDAEVREKSINLDEIQGDNEVIFAFRGDEITDELRDQLVVRDRSSRLYDLLGHCIEGSGNQREAAKYHEKAAQFSMQINHIDNATVDFTNAASCFIKAGDFAHALEATYNALGLSFSKDGKTARGKLHIRLLRSHAMFHLAWITHLKGDIKRANQAFDSAMSLEVAAHPLNDFFSPEYLYSRQGIQLANYLVLREDLETAENITRHNLFINLIGLKRKHEELACNRILADIELHRNNLDLALEQYSTILVDAYKISLKEEIASCLIGIGRLTLKSGSYESAKKNLNDALRIAEEASLLLLEIDIRIELARLSMLQENFIVAHQEVSKAIELANNIGYFWGQRDALNLLGELGVAQHDEDEMQKIKVDLDTLNRKLDVDYKVLPHKGMNFLFRFLYYLLYVFSLRIVVFFPKIKIATEGDKAFWDDIRKELHARGFSTDLFPQ